MAKQMLILVDENDVLTGEYADKGECHFGEGLHHRAFVVAIYNSRGEILLQLRKHVRWDKYWDLAAISHVLHLEDRDEAYDEAGSRSLKDEMGIAGVDLKKIGAFNYFAKYHGHCENEYCAVLVGVYEGEVNPNREVVYEYEWVSEDKFFNDISENPDKYTPWAIDAVPILKNK